MTKGTAGHGRKSGKKIHIHCRRCGGHSYHIKDKKCASCGYGSSARVRNYAWNKKK